MKVLVSTRAVYPFHGYGGMEKYFYYLSKHLAEEGIDVEILSSSDGSGRRSAEFQGIKYNFVSPDFRRRLIGPFSFYPYYYYFNFRAMRYLRHADFDIIHGLGGLTDYLLFDHRRPAVLQVVGLESFKDKNLALRTYFYYMAYLSTRIDMRLAEAVATEVEAEARDIIALFKVPREKIFHLPNGVDLDEIDYLTKVMKTTKKDLKIEDADITLINVNRLELNKGVRYLIEALKILNKELDVRLLMIGTGSEEERIVQQIESLGLKDKVLRFRNISDEEKFQLYRLADVSITPTLFEGLPTVILEAMACGKPIIASNIPEIAQVVQDKKNAFLIQPGNPQAIARKVLAMYDKTLFGKMGFRSKEIARKYDWSIIARTAIRKYEELLGK